MSVPAIVTCVIVGLGFWGCGANMLYNFLELVDALRPAKPDEKSAAGWIFWGSAAVICFPLVMLLGVFGIATVLMRLCVSDTFWSRRESSTDEGTSGV